MLSPVPSRVEAMEVDDVEKATLTATEKSYIPSHPCGEALVVAVSGTGVETIVSVNPANLNLAMSQKTEPLKTDDRESDDLDFKSLQLKRRRTPRGNNDDTGTQGGSGPTRKRPKLAPRMKATALIETRTASYLQTEGSSSSSTSTVDGGQSMSHSSKSKILASATSNIVLAKKTAGAEKTAEVESVEAEEGKK